MIPMNEESQNQIYMSSTVTLKAVNKHEAMAKSD